MSVNNFIPNLWSGAVLANLNKAQIFAQPGVANRDYEGEIQQMGDTVKITSIGPITARAYSRNTDMVAPDQLNDSAMSFIIDQAQYFNYAIDDVDARQSSASLLDAATVEAAYAISNQQDIYMSGLYTQVSATNAVGTSGAPQTDLATVGQPWLYLTKLKKFLDQANVPMEGRWCIIPPWFEALLLLDPKFYNSFLVDLTQAVLRNGNVGRQVVGFTLLRSNNVNNYASTNYAIMAGHGMAWTVAEQIVKVEAYRPPYRFADAFKGLHVYGAKVVRPNALAVLFAQAA